jgi:acetolactate decarboxylase
MGKLKSLLRKCLTVFSNLSRKPVSQTHPDLVQAGTLIGLMQGVYQGSTSFQQLLTYGNFGLGTSNGVQGELVIDEGNIYLSDIEGKSILLSCEEKTPFAMIVNFQPDQVYDLTNILNMQMLEQVIDQRLLSHNFFYAIKVTGCFNLTGRTVPRVEGNVPLNAWIKQHQRIFHLDEIAGTLIIFRSPEYASPLTVPGYHVHFISSDKKQVFHLYDVSFKQAKIEIQTLENYKILLPTSENYQEKNLQPITSTEIVSMEKHAPTLIKE